jgi:hypothetical protein
MGRDRVAKCAKRAFERYHGGFELAGDTEEARLLAALNKRPSKLTWRRRYNKDVPSDTGICTPYGWLEVRGVGGFIVSARMNLSATLAAGFNPVAKGVGGPPCLSPVPQHRRRRSCT